MLKIKLARTGAKNNPSYRIVVAPDRSKLTGRYKDLLGFHNPVEKKTTIDRQKLEHWISKGAIPTPKVLKLSKIH